MKKLLVISIMLFSLLGTQHAYAVVPVVDAAANTLLTISNAMNEAWQKAKDAFDQSVWVQQAKDMMESLQRLKKQIDEIMGLRDDVMNTFSGVRNTNISDYLNKGSETVDYRYAGKLPTDYVSVNCNYEGTCSSNSKSYAGKALSGITSNSIRESWHVPDGVITETDVRQLTYQAAEEYAQQIAVIQAMAQEAYAQSNNRIAKIEELEGLISGITGSVNSKSVVSSATTGPTATSGPTATTYQDNNDLKYVADLQARIQVEQALLLNEQNKLASLAIQQQSLADAYEQRKREIAAYTISGGEDHGFSLSGIARRAAVEAATAGAYAMLTAAYK